MKRLGSSDSLAGLISICPTATDENSPRSDHVYSREFRSVFEGLDDEMEDSGHVPEKKRRLSVHQVKALEKNFEVENKLEPERKVKLAQELGLQPRQVAIWFQNRRARWKTKQLERDYGVLKANYDALKHNFEALQHDNEALLNEIRDLRAKLGEDDRESNKAKSPPLSPPPPLLLPSQTQKESSFESFNNGGNGSSDSDSSAILNEEINASTTLPMSPSSCSLNCTFEFQNFYQQQQQVVKMEEQNFFTADEACSFFSDEQWYCSEQWN